MRHLEELIYPEILNPIDIEKLKRHALHLEGLIEPDVGTTQPPSQSELLEISDRISVARQIDAHPIPAMLAHGPGLLAVGKLQAHVLLASLSEIALDREFTQVQNACRRIRQLHSGQPRHKQLNEWVQDIPDDSTASVLNWIMETSRHFEKTGKKNLSRSVKPFEYLLRRYIEDRVITRDGEGNRTRRSSSLAPGESSEIAEVTHHVFSNSQTDGDIDSGERFLEAKASGSKAHKSESNIQTHRARQAYAHIAQNHMHSPLQWGNLTPASLRGLVRELASGIAAGNLVDVVILLSLVSGRHCEKITKLPIYRLDQIPPARERSDDDFIVYGHDKSGYRYAVRTKTTFPKYDHGQNQFRPGDKPLFLPIPDQLVPALARPQPSLSVPETKLKEREREIQQAHPRITLTQIAHCGYQRLIQAGEQHTYLDRCFGIAPSRSTPQTYENMDIQSVLAPYNRWMKEITAHVSQGQFSIQIKKTGGHVGSNRTPEADAIRTLFAALRSRIKSLKKLRSLSQLHRHYVVYVWSVLSFATAMRPAKNAPFETLEFYCRRSRTYFLQDKDSDQPNPRIVPLADVAIAQIDSYLAHLRSLRTRLIGPPLDYLELALSGEEPYLFTFDGEGPKFLTSKVIRSVVKPFWDYDHNWPRHLLRTEFMADGVRDDVARTYLDHGELGQEPFARHSNMSIHRLRSVLPTIERVANELEIRPLGINPHDH